MMMTNSATTIPALHVKVLCLPEAMLGTVFSAIDVLQLANMVMKLRNCHTPPSLSWSMLLPEGNPPIFAEGVASEMCSPPPAEKPTPPRTVLVVPAVYATNAPELPLLARRYPDVLELICAHVEQGGAVATCCTGLIFAAETGLLRGARLDTHWAFKPTFVRTVPECDFSSTESVNVNGRLFTCVAPTEQTELMITVLRHLYDAEVADSCARIMQVQTERQLVGNVQMAKNWQPRTADSPVYRAKHWLEMNVGQPYDLKELAAIASSSERTLLRHFKSVLGVTPLNYLQDLRVQRAKIMLEISIDSMQTIAHVCGYANASTFGKLFRRATGLSPGEYRKQNTFRTKRSHWRVGVGT